MSRQCNLCSRYSRGYKLHWKALNKKLRAINIYNVRQRLRYYYYNSFSSQKLRGKFKAKCRDLSWFNFKKPLQCWAGNKYIYARKNEVKCTTMTSKWFIINNKLLLPKHFNELGKIVSFWIMKKSVANNFYLLREQSNFSKCYKH